MLLENVIRRHFSDFMDAEEGTNRWNACCLIYDYLDDMSDNGRKWLTDAQAYGVLDYVCLHCYDSRVVIELENVTDIYFGDV